MEGMEEFMAPNEDSPWHANLPAPLTKLPDLASMDAHVICMQPDALDERPLREIFRRVHVTKAADGQFYSGSTIGTVPLIPIRSRHAKRLASSLLTCLAGRIYRTDPCARRTGMIAIAMTAIGRRVDWAAAPARIVSFEARARLLRCV